MLAARKQYIINQNNSEANDVDVSGFAANSLHQLSKANIVTPEAVILTTQAFDDFITSANIVQKITQILDDLDYDSLAAVSMASQNIHALILQASIPSLILQPLISAYHGLSGLTEKYVAIKPSWLMPDAYVPESDRHVTFLNVKGEANMVYHVKKAWCQMFSPEGIMFRHNANYEGGLSMAVIIQKMIQAEASGVAFSVDPTDNNLEEVEVQAILGLYSPANAPELNTDVYKVAKAESRITEKVITEQTHMLLRKGRAQPDEDPMLKVPISPVWRKNQKISDPVILGISGIVRKVSDSFKTQVELSWALSDDVIYTVSVKPYRKLELIDKYALDADRYPVKNIVQIIPSNSESPEVDETLRSKPDFDSLTSKVWDIVKEEEEKEIEQEQDFLQKMEQANYDGPKPVNLNKIEHDLNLPTLLPEVDLSQTVDLAKHLNTETDLPELASVKLVQNLVNFKANSLYVANNTKAAHVTLSSEESVLQWQFSWEALAKMSNSAEVSFSFTAPNNAEELLNADYYINHPKQLFKLIQELRKAKHFAKQEVGFVALPAVNSLEQLGVLKKQEGISTSLKGLTNNIFVQLSYPGLAFELDQLTKSDADGIVVNVMDLAYFAHGGKVVASNLVLPILQSITKSAKLPVVINLQNASPELANQILTKLTKVPQVMWDGNDWEQLNTALTKLDAIALKPSKAAKGRPIKVLTAKK